MSERSKGARRLGGATTVARADLRGPRGDVERAQRAERSRGVQGRGRGNRGERA
jgi:hypothetical protein